MHLANCHFGKVSDTPSIIAVHFIIWMATTVKWSSTWCVIITITSRYERISAIHVFMFIVMMIILHHHFYMHKNVYLFNFFSSISSGTGMMKISTWVHCKNTKEWELLCGDTNNDNNSNFNHDYCPCHLMTFVRLFICKFCLQNVLEVILLITLKIMSLSNAISWVKKSSCPSFWIIVITLTVKLCAYCACKQEQHGQMVFTRHVRWVVTILCHSLRY